MRLMSQSGNFWAFSSHMLTKFENFRQYYPTYPYLYTILILRYGNNNILHWRFQLLNLVLTIKEIWPAEYRFTDFWFFHVLCTRFSPFYSTNQRSHFVQQNLASKEYFISVACKGIGLKVSNGNNFVLQCLERKGLEKAYWFALIINDWNYRSEKFNLKIRIFQTSQLQP